MLGSSSLCMTAGLQGQRIGRHTNCCDGELQQRQCHNFQQDTVVVVICAGGGAVAENAADAVAASVVAVASAPTVVAISCQQSRWLR